MTESQARLRSIAAADIDETIAYLRSAASDAVALNFVEALENGINHVTRSLQLGSLRFAFELGIPDLRAFDLSQFPYVLFYLPLNDTIDIWRVLHTGRDIPGAFALDQ